ITVTSYILVLSTLPSSTTFLNTHLSFTPTPHTAIYTLSLHDALPIYLPAHGASVALGDRGGPLRPERLGSRRAYSLRPEMSSLADRKSTRLNSSHQIISYAVFCLKKKKNSIEMIICGRNTQFILCWQY